MKSETGRRILLSCINLKRKLNSIFSHSLLTEGEYFAILEIDRRNRKNVVPPKVSEIADALGVARPAATRMLNTLEEKGYVQKEITKTDRRVVYLSLTEKGEELLRRAEQVVNYIVEQVEQQFGEQDANEIVRLTNQLAKFYETLDYSHINRDIKHFSPFSC